jgi:Fe-S cluster biogenesis protein NfuA
MAEILENTLSREKVEAALDKVRPGLQADGGDVRLVDVKDGVVTVRLTGACAGCPMSTMTLRAGVERVLRQELPEVKKVVAA